MSVAAPGPVDHAELQRPLPGLAAPPPTDATAGGPPAAHALLRHPRARQALLLGGLQVGYELVRVRRRSIGMVVTAEGLSVRAPRWVGLGDIEAALQAKARWLLGKLGEQGERQRRLAAGRIDWVDGACLPYLGETLVLRLDPQQRGLALREAAPDETPPGRRLLLGLPPQADALQVRDAVQAWLMKEARRVFLARLAHYAPTLGVQVRRLALSSARTRWGSASADGSIRLNWRLIHFSLATLDYVVVHELAHLRHMDHSPRFWDVVRGVLPDFDQARAALRDPVLPAFD
jgi:predicted metal-dependent hydrolase